MAALNPTTHALLFDPGYGRAPCSSAFEFAAKAGNALLDLLYPPHCSSCNAPLPSRIGSVICEGCSARVRWIGDDRCMRCGDMTGTGAGAREFCVSCKQHPPRFIKGAACCARYETGPIRDLMLGLKFGGRAFQSKMMGRLLARRIIETGLLDMAPTPILVPTPLARSGLFKRGFNQSAEIAYWIGIELKLNVESGMLRKIRATRPQATLSSKQRRVNLSGAFAVSTRQAKKYQASNVLLIDDVITTGSTISECARTLHDAGMGRIVAASFARG